MLSGGIRHQERQGRSHSGLRLRCRHFLRAIACPIRGRPANTLCQLDNSGVLARLLCKSLSDGLLGLAPRWIRQLGINE